MKIKSTKKADESSQSLIPSKSESCIVNTAIKKEKKKQKKNKENGIAEIDVENCQINGVETANGVTSKRKRKRDRDVIDVTNEVEYKKPKQIAEVVDDSLISVKQLKTEVTDDYETTSNKKTKKMQRAKNGTDEHSIDIPVDKLTVSTGNGNVEMLSTGADDHTAFSNFRISDAVVQKLIAKGITSLFPVQSESFDAIYDGYDVIVQARTGSGKTLSFAIPLVEKLLQKNTAPQSARSPQVLVMAPTRELAKQVSESFETICSGLSVLCVYGGTHIGPQERTLRSGVDILVGTPGRIQDLITRGCLDLTQLQHVVLDEVDRMLDMGFADDVDAILSQRYSQGEQNPQTLLFSATLPHWLHETAKKYLRTDRKHLDLVGRDPVRTSKTVQHLAIRCSYFDRAATIGAVMQVYSGSQGRAMVFCETKRDADELALSSDIRQETHVIHGDIPQDKREMVLKGFRDGRYKCLIATDVAARGLDIPEVDLVVQCCPPKDVDSYIHRAGRTGRAGRDGTCVLFFKPNEEYELGYVEQRAGINFKRIAPPSARDVIKACAQDAVRTLESVGPLVREHFKDVAEKLAMEKNVVDILSAALAVISGNTELKQRSLLSSREGFTALMFRTNIEMKQLGYAWKGLERCIPRELKDKITWMTFCADKMGCVFDVPSDDAEIIISKWRDGRFDTLIQPTELPELLQQDRLAERHSFGGTGGQRPSFGRGGGRGGGRGRGRFSSNGWSRDFNRNGMLKKKADWQNGHSQNSRKSFD